MAISLEHSLKLWLQYHALDYKTKFAWANRGL